MSRPANEVVASWGRHVIDTLARHVNDHATAPILEAINSLRNLLQEAVANLRHASESILGLRADIAALPSTVAAPPAQPTIALSPDNRAGQQPPDPNRVFFTNLGAAIASTQAVLSNLPPRSYPVTPPTLPLEELFGQLHAIHANSVQWFRHIESLLAANDQHLDSQISGLREQQSKSLQAATATLLSEISRIIGGAPSTSTTLDDLMARLSDIADRLPSASVNQALEVLTEAVKRLQGETGPMPLPVPRPPLPPYIAAHPTGRPRTHGVLRFDDVHTRIPMDMVSRPPSTSLELTLALRRTHEHSEIVAALYDAGALLISKHIRTPHSLDDLPGDALALLHQACPSFIYKLSRLGAC